MNPQLRTAIEAFIDKHDPSDDQQHKALVEEVGELAEALNRDASDEDVTEELADIVFVAHTLSYMRGIDLEFETVKTARENVNKSTATEGNKITKAVTHTVGEVGESEADASDCESPSGDHVELHSTASHSPQRERGDELASRVLEDTAHLVDSDRSSVTVNIGCEVNTDGT